MSKQNYCYQCCLADICKRVDRGTHTLASPACDAFDPGMRWIPVTERLPEQPPDRVDEHGNRYFTPTGRYLAVIKSTGVVCELSYTYCNKEFWYEHSLKPIKVTHWMPLPDAPEK